LGLRFQRRTCASPSGDGDEGNGDLPGNGDLLLLLPLTSGFLVVVVTVSNATEQSFNLFSSVGFVGNHMPNLVILWGITWEGNLVNFIKFSLFKHLMRVFTEFPL
jgi:hypothetical protein